MSKCLSDSHNAVQVERPASLYYKDKEDWTSGEISLCGSAGECDETAQRENGAPRYPEMLQVLINTGKPLQQFLVLQLEMSPYGNISK